MGDIPFGVSPFLVKKWIANFAIVAGTGLLLFLAMRKMDPSAILNQIKEGNYIWLIPMTAIVFFAHWVRAWRWKILLDAVRDTQPVKLSKSFGSILVGYMVNFLTPRAGEFARALVLSKTETRPFMSTMGTIVADRALDIVSVLLGLLSVIVLLRQKIDVFVETFVQPIVATALDNQTMTAISVMILLLVAVGVWQLFRSQKAKQMASFSLFADGFSSIRSSGRIPEIVASTCIIWLCYTLMAYLPLKMYAVDANYGLNLVDAWCLMLIGSVAFAFPSPGGIGSYHFVTILAMTSLYGVSDEPAATYALVVNGVQWILYVASGAIAAAILGLGYGSLRREIKDKGNSGSPKT